MPTTSKKKPTPEKKKRRFTVTVTATVEIDQSVFDEVEKDDWRGTFYNLQGDEEVAAHVGGNLIRGASFSQLDGFGRLPDDAARSLDDWDAEAEEIKP
jgi:hypothetical protein